MRRYLRNDPDLRMAKLAAGTRIWLPDADLARLDPRHLGRMIEELREGEAMVRKLRKRLEALQAGDPRPCPECGRSAAGRADAIYCSAGCRVRAHRSRLETR